VTNGEWRERESKVLEQDPRRRSVSRPKEPKWARKNSLKNERRAKLLKRQKFVRDKG
jgi:hypothetical protein